MLHGFAMSVVTLSDVVGSVDFDVFLVPLPVFCRGREVEVAPSMAMLWWTSFSGGRGDAEGRLRVVREGQWTAIR